MEATRVVKSKIVNPVELALSALDDVPLDRALTSQSSLDLANRSRTNPFPWRGQFSPELVELLLSQFASEGFVVLDPYAGVGTTLIEAARRGLPAVGVEINPAAVAMGRTCVFVGLMRSRRRKVLDAVWSMLDTFAAREMPLFRRKGEDLSIPDRLVQLIAQNESDPFTCNVLTNVLIRLLEPPGRTDADSLFRAFEQHKSIVLELPYSTTECRIVDADARALPLDKAAIDLVITSPPYINVFNYHQNNRKAMELLGWDLLSVAHSEIGSNRKHRGNRLLTVIQYCVDMSLALAEFRRVMKPNGRVIMVIGRESNVRKTAFENGAILGAIARACGFRLPFRQERKFVSRFGPTVYEDILHLVPGDMWSLPDLSTVRRIAVLHLEAARSRAGDQTILEDINDAISRADSVRASPIYDPTRARKL